MQRPKTAILLAALALGAAALPGCGDDEAPATTAAEAPAEANPGGEPAPGDRPAPDQPADETEPPPPNKPSGPAENAADDPRPTALERAAERTVRSYVAALDAARGARVCALLAPGALEQLELPRERRSCAASLDASIGYRDPRGLPVFAGVRVSAVQSVEVNRDSARVVVTVITEFADRAEPSIEDDLVFLVRDGNGWLIAKPSSSLYRAVGIADVPPTVLTPP